MHTDDGRKEVRNYGICTGPKGSDTSKNKDHVQPDEAAVDLFWTCCSCGGSLLSFDTKTIGTHDFRIFHGDFGTPVFLFCHV